MSTRLISWQSVVDGADPSYHYNRQHQLRDEFSSGRLFYSPVGNIYQAFVPMTDDNGNPLESDIWHRILETGSINPRDLMPGAALVRAAGSANPPPDIHGSSPYRAFVPMTDGFGNPIESDIWHNILETDSINPGDLMPVAAIVHAAGSLGPPPDPAPGPSPYTAYVPMTNDYGDPIESDVWGHLLETDSINPHDLWAQNQMTHRNDTP